MSSQSGLAEIKQQVFAKIGKIPGVAGVGLPEQGLTIYLESDSTEVRAAAEEALSGLHAGVPIHWQVAGTFKAL